jgi:hypothetical protein
MSKPSLQKAPEYNDRQVAVCSPSGLGIGEIVRGRAGASARRPYLGWLHAAARMVLR